MSNCRHSILSLPPQVVTDSATLRDQALRESYPMNQSAAAVLARVDGQRSIEDIANDIGIEESPNDLIDPIIGLAEHLNQAYLLNLRKPWSFAEAACSFREFWTQIVFCQSFPLPSGRQRIDLTDRQRDSFSDGAVKLARHSASAVAPLLALASFVLVTLALVARDASGIILVAALFAGVVAAVAAHELGHYVVFTKFEAPPRRLFLKSSFGSCGFVHASLPRWPAVATTVAGPLAPLLCAVFLLLIPALPDEVRLITLAVAFSQAINLSAVTSDGRQVIAYLVDKSADNGAHKGTSRWAEQVAAFVLGGLVGGVCGALAWTGVSLIETQTGLAGGPSVLGPLHLLLPASLEASQPLASLCIWTTAVGIANVFCLRWLGTD